MLNANGFKIRLIEKADIICGMMERESFNHGKKKHFNSVHFYAHAFGSVDYLFFVHFEMIVFFLNISKTWISLHSPHEYSNIGKWLRIIVNWICFYSNRLFIIVWSIKEKRMFIDKFEQKHVEIIEWGSKWNEMNKS